METVLLDEMKKMIGKKVKVQVAYGEQDYAKGILEEVNEEFVKLEVEKSPKDEKQYPLVIKTEDVVAIEEISEEELEYKEGDGSEEEGL